MWMRLTHRHDGLSVFLLLNRNRSRYVQYDCGRGWTFLGGAWRHAPPSHRPQPLSSRYNRSGWTRKRLPPTWTRTDFVLPCSAVPVLSPFRESASVQTWSPTQTAGPAQRQKECSHYFRRSSPHQRRLPRHPAKLHATVLFPSVAAHEKALF